MVFVVYKTYVGYGLEFADDLLSVYEERLNPSR